MLEGTMLRARIAPREGPLLTPIPEAIMWESYMTALNTDEVCGNL